MPTEGGATDKAVGRTGGRLNTKLHVIVDGLGNPVEFMLSAYDKLDASFLTFVYLASIAILLI